MNMVGKIEHGGTLGKLEQVSLWGEHKHLVLIEVHLKLVHSLQTVAGLKHRADIRQPLVHACITFYAFVAPVSRYTSFGHLVHPLRTNLHLDPSLFRAQYGDMKTLVAVGLWHRKPVSQSFGVGLVHARDDGEGLPAVHDLTAALLGGRTVSAIVG